MNSKNTDNHIQSSITHNRDCTIDIIRGIAIILMVIGHSGCPTPLRSFIYLFHIAIFYIVSGFFFKIPIESSPLAFVKKKINGLYLTYIKWGIAFLLLHNLLAFINIESSFWDWNDLAHAFMDVILFHKVDILIGPLWFIKSLFITSLFIYIVAYMAKNKIFIMGG